MDAVTGDHGSVDDPADYYRGPMYLNRPGPLTLLMYWLLVDLINRRVEGLRKNYQDPKLCGCTASAEPRIEPA